MMDLLDFYYYNLGTEPTEFEREITKATLGHLIDNNLTEKDIINIIKDFPAKMALEPSDLPNSLWENSLLNRDTFYYHSELHITSPAPYWDFENDRIVSSRFFLEMKIQYSIRDLIQYYYKKFPRDIRLIDDKKDNGTMEYLLNKYKNIAFIEPVDFILFLIDEAANSDYELTEMIDLKRFETQAFSYLEYKTMNAAVEKMNKIVWR